LTIEASRVKFFLSPASAPKMEKETLKTVQVAPQKERETPPGEVVIFERISLPLDKGNGRKKK